MTDSPQAKHCFDTLFANLVDPRDQSKVTYPLTEILFQSVSAIICGAEGPTDIMVFAKNCSDWLREYYSYAKGFADHDTINRVLGLLPVDDFERLFIQWVHQTFTPPDHMKHIAIDGKRIARSVRSKDQQKSRKQGGAHAKVLVNALNVELRLVLAQVDVSQTMSEVAGAKYLLDLLSLEGKCITADAGFLGRELISLIRDKQADYLMTLKAKSPRYYKATKAAFKQLEEDDSITKTEIYIEEEQGHGRKTKRIYEVLKINSLENKLLSNFYQDACVIVRVKRWHDLNKEKAKFEQHYYVSNKNSSVKELASLIRNHWAVENNLHWILDVAFKEDDTRAWSRNLAVNLALIRKMAFNLIAESSRGKGVKRKRWAASLSIKARDELLKSIMR